LVMWNRRNAALNQEALSRLRAGAGDRVLDVGFGGGYLIDQLLKQKAVRHISGVDASAAMVEQCRRRFAGWIRSGALDLQCASVDSLPYPDGSFERVTSVNSLFFWEDLRPGLREIRRVLSSRGLLVLSYTSKHDLDKRGLASHGVRSFGEDEVARALGEEGFRDVQVERGRDRYREYLTVTATR
jgi:ubiquinone/menaquinone biosynthesis C-methylase UbiE